MAKKKKATNKKIKKKTPNILGSWSFLIGVILAIALGIGFTGDYQKPILWIVFLLGIIVGVLNIKVEEYQGFLTGSTVLVLVSFLGIQVGIFDAVAPIIRNILIGVLTLFVPATIIVALRVVWVMAKR
jgi:hypothetical protein